MKEEKFGAAPSLFDSLLATVKWTQSLKPSVTAALFQWWRDGVQVLRVFARFSETKLW